MTQDTEITRSSELRVSIAIGAGFLLHTAFAFTWAGSAAERINQLERRVDAREALMDRTARLEEQVDAVRHTLLRIEAKIDSKEEGVE
ncbi:MAG: hypothetical protein AAF850_12450 [Pseudomonadota bacterium]